MPKVIKVEDNIKREQIMSNILEILGKKEENTEVIFFLSKIDENENIQNKIYELEQDIKKYYICSTWPCFHISKETKRKWLGIIKSLCKEHNKEIKSGFIKYTDCTNDTIYIIK
jgi:hypothetical protein